MPTYQNARLPPPGDWQELERICRALYKQIYPHWTVQRYGRSGQKQRGVDVYAMSPNGPDCIGLQCKCVGTLKPDAIARDYAKSKECKLPLTRFTVFTTAPRNVRAQNMAADLTKSGPYCCEVMSWEDIVEEVSKFPDVLREFYPQYVVVRTDANVVGTIIDLQLPESACLLVISHIGEEHRYLRDAVLVADVMGRRCIPTHIGAHRSRLEEIFGEPSYEAFFITEWLNSFDSVDQIVGLGTSVQTYDITQEGHDAFRQYCRAFHEAG
ncbi:MAG: hypothetical protein AUJ96_10825 [Armatimonadetes bacterium CG2_30_66_41]|nr:hypothetical protein [Armatimonadota bacterium]NCO90330.1 hypothetical protein [Armatimonadota bacterium]OIP05464.1 MAG: hypothetical protein AUJ96_10825 [Armatimonadetes bacterium CG2_30_66_41]PIU92978.1 MAG: hypothetical protein COS65_15195 [Armatimonadetes bacterium CG06_land_8_20_14_3_00_66_21]